MHNTTVPRQVFSSNCVLSLATLFVILTTYSSFLLFLNSCTFTLPAIAGEIQDNQRSNTSGLVARGTAQLRIMTWNIRYDNPDDGVHAWPNRRSELLAFVKSQNPDILCIQEGLHAQVEFLGSGLPGFDRRGVGRDDGKQDGEYSAIYFRKARFGCSDEGTFWLSPTPSVPGKGWDAACTRIVTWVRLYDSVTATVLTVFNTHFDHEGIQARQHSARLLRRKAREIAGDRPLVVAGDFNTVETDSAYRILTSRDGMPPYLEDAIRRSATPHRGPWATFTGFAMKEPDPGERIDFLFVSDSVLVRDHCTRIARRPAGYLSDHLPVCADIVLR